MWYARNNCFWYVPYSLLSTMQWLPEKSNHIKIILNLIQTAIILNQKLIFPRVHCTQVKLYYSKLLQRLYILEKAP